MYYNLSQPGLCQLNGVSDAQHEDSTLKGATKEAYKHCIKQGNFYVLFIFVKQFLHNKFEKHSITHINTNTSECYWLY